MGTVTKGFGARLGKRPFLVLDFRKTLFELKIIIIIMFVYSIDDITRNLQ